jgi:hypothetical protein
MDALDKKEKLRKTRIAFFSILPILIFSMLVFLESFDKMVLWRIIASSVGFLVFLSLTLLVFRQLIRLQKMD